MDKKKIQDIFVWIGGSLIICNFPLVVFAIKEVFGIACILIFVGFCLVASAILHKIIFDED